jgi:hypothetical protein
MACFFKRYNRLRGLCTTQHRTRSVASQGEGLRQDVFDLFAAAFYLVTRYEEYLPFIADRHNRFEASQSVLFKHGLLERPLINEWAEDLKQTFFKNPCWFAHTCRFVPL